MVLNVSQKGNARFGMQSRIRAFKDLAETTETTPWLVPAGDPWPTAAFCSIQEHRRGILLNPRNRGVCPLQNHGKKLWGVWGLQPRVTPWIPRTLNSATRLTALFTMRIVVKGPIKGEQAPLRFACTAIPSFATPIRIWSVED